MLSSISITAKTAVVRNAKLSHSEFVHTALSHWLTVGRALHLCRVPCALDVP
jgi:hypothetical protein